VAPIPGCCALEISSVYADTILEDRHDIRTCAEFFLLRFAHRIAAHGGHGPAVGLDRLLERIASQAE
jgi:hypothetical protein